MPEAKCREKKPWKSPRGFGWVDKAQCFRSARWIGAAASSLDFSRVFFFFFFFLRHLASRHLSRDALLKYKSLFIFVFPFQLSRAPVDASSFCPSPELTKDDLASAVVQEALSSWNPMKADYENLTNSYGVDFDDPGEALVAYRKCSWLCCCYFLLFLLSLLFMLFCCWCFVVVTVVIRFCSLVCVCVTSVFIWLVVL